MSMIESASIQMTDGIRRASVFINNDGTMKIGPFRDDSYFEVSQADLQLLLDLQRKVIENRNT